MPGLVAQPLTPPSEKSTIDFGAVIHDADVEHLTDEQFAEIYDALYRNSVVVLKNQAHVSPKAQYELTQRFDPAAEGYGHGKGLQSKSILHPDLKTIPHQPEVQVIGNGFVSEYEGLKDIKLKHPHHRTFHKTVIPEEEDLDFTRFYRWHIDAALYAKNPPFVTSLMAVSVPKGRVQTVRYDDGTGDELTVPLGTTAFVSGYTTYDILTPEQKEFVRTSKIEYAPHPYVWMSQAKALSTGLGIHSDNLELPTTDLPEIDHSKVQILPMLWQNPVTKQYALQIHPSAISKIHRADGTVIDDLKEVRRIVYELQRPGISPQYVYPHDWEEGDLVLFNNRGVLHTVVGAFRDDEIRLFRQCNLAGSVPPKGPE